MNDKVRCAACVASRKTTVDAFMEGYIAGYITTVATMSPAAELETPQFCLAHDRMVTEKYAEALRTIFPGTGG